MDKYIDKVSRAICLNLDTIDSLTLEDFDTCFKHKDQLLTMNITFMTVDLYCKLFQHNICVDEMVSHIICRNISNIEYLNSTMHPTVFESILDKNVYLLRYDLRLKYKSVFDNIIGGDSFCAFDLYNWSFTEKYVKYFNHDDFNRLISDNDFSINHCGLIQYATKRVSIDIIKSFPMINWDIEQLYKRGLIDAYYIEEKALTEHNSKSYYDFWRYNNICTWKTGQNAKCYRGDYLKALMTFLLCAHRHHIPVEISHAIIELAISNVNTLK